MADSAVDTGTRRNSKGCPNGDVRRDTLRVCAGKSRHIDAILDMQVPVTIPVNSHVRGSSGGRDTARGSRGNGLAAGRGKRQRMADIDAVDVGQGVAPGNVADTDA